MGFTLEKTGFVHGCLSAIDEKRAWVETHTEVLIAFYSLLDLEPKVKKYKGMGGIIVQHEFNHVVTSGTYIDAGNQWLTGDRFKEAENFYLEPEEAKKSTA